MSEVFLPGYDECQNAISNNDADAIEIFIYEYEPVIGNTEFRDKLRYALLHHAAELRAENERLKTVLEDYINVVEGAVGNGVYEHNNKWWNELSRLSSYGDSVGIRAIEKAGE